MESSEHCRVDSMCSPDTTPGRVNNYVKLESRKTETHPRVERELLFFNDHDSESITEVLRTVVHKRIEGTMRGVGLYPSVWRHCPGMPSWCRVIGE